MKLRHLALVALVAASVAACADSPTAAKPGTRTPVQRALVESDSAGRAPGGGLTGSGH